MLTPADEISVGAQRTCTQLTAPPNCFDAAVGRQCWRVHRNKALHRPTVCMLLSTMEV